MSGLDEVSLVLSPTERYLNPRQLQDYRAEREACIRWLLTSGKDPEKHDGYALSTVKTRSRHMDRFYRWVWDRENGYTLNVTPDHADAWMKHLAQQDGSGAHKSNCQKAIRSLFKWRHHERGGAEWEPSITFSDSSATQPRDYLTREERTQLREAALEYGSIPTYSNLTPAERDRWRAHLAQRFEKPKDEVVPADWELVPWHSWRHEFFKPMGTLQDADRGGFIFAPEVGIHEDVHELDFSSLYPNIICTRNVSPDVIRCDCHRHREDVPEIGYAVCDERGYLVDVLQPLIDDRDAIKAQINKETQQETPNEDRLAELEGRSDALKWILVACFGYQGFNNAKFGRIECHEAINAFAREILLTAKQRLEAGGWRVVHGIVDSIWVTPDPETTDADRTSLETLTAEITDAVGIRLEYEAAYEWVGFVPQRHSDAGALTKYFGKLADDDAFKLRGIEARQRSTPPFVETVQRACLDCFAATRSPEAVITRLEKAITRLHAGHVDPDRLVEEVRVSKPLDAYTHTTRTVAALQRADAQDLTAYPGQHIKYVVVDDTKSTRDRVALAHENPQSYDAAYYETQLIRAAECLLSPLGWDRTDIRRVLDGHETPELATFIE